MAVTVASNDTQHNKRIVRLVVDEFLNKGDAQALHDNSQPEYQWIPVSDNQPMDLETHKRDFPELRTIYGNLRYEIKHQIAEGDLVATHGTMTGTHIGEIKSPFGVFAPTGKTASWDTISFHRFRDGKIVEGWISYNPLDALQQLGLVNQWPPGYGSARPATAFLPRSP
jgi:predicted ester cyclase